MDMDKSVFGHFTFLIENFPHVIQRIPLVMNLGKQTEKDRRTL